MELSTILLALAVLACPITMGVMMWRMNKNMDGQHGHPPAHQTDSHRLAALLEQRRQLEQEIAEAERMAALEDRKTPAAETRSPLPEG